MKTLAIRLEDDQHARAVMLSKLAGVSLTDAIREAIDAHLTKLAADPEVSAKAAQAREEIDREAAEQRQALAALFPEDSPSPKTSRTRQNKT